MPHNLVAKLSGLKHKGFITEVEYDRLMKGLNSLRVDEMYQLEMENAEEFIAKSVIEDIKAEIAEEKECAYADFEQYKVDYLGIDAKYVEDELPNDNFGYGMERCLEIICKRTSGKEQEE